MSRERSLLACAEIEIVEMHDFFVSWFASRASDDRDFERCEQALDEGFGMVAPDGHFYRRAEVIVRLRAARGSTDADFRISTEAISPLWQSEDAILVGYIEAQLRSGLSTRRRSSALFARKSSTRNGVAWRHLHETWA